MGPTGHRVRSLPASTPGHSPCPCVSGNGGNPSSPLSPVTGLWGREHLMANAFSSCLVQPHLLRPPLEGNDPGYSRSAARGSGGAGRGLGRHQGAAVPACGVLDGVLDGRLGPSGARPGLRLGKRLLGPTPGSHLPARHFLPRPTLSPPTRSTSSAAPPPATPRARGCAPRHAPRGLRVSPGKRGSLLQSVPRPVSGAGPQGLEANPRCGSFSGQDSGDPWVTTTAPPGPWTS